MYNFLQKTTKVAITFSFQESKTHSQRKEKGIWNMFEDGMNTKMTATSCFLFLRKWSR